MQEREAEAPPQASPGGERQVDLRGQRLWPMAAVALCPPAAVFYIFSSDPSSSLPSQRGIPGHLDRPIRSRPDPSLPLHRHYLRRCCRRRRHCRCLCYQDPSSDGGCRVRFAHGLWSSASSHSCPSSRRWLSRTSCPPPPPPASAAAPAAPIPPLLPPPMPPTSPLLPLPSPPHLRSNQEGGALLYTCRTKCTTSRNF